MNDESMNRLLNQSLLTIRIYIYKTTINSCTVDGGYELRHVQYDNILLLNLLLLIYQ